MLGTFLGRYLKRRTSLITASITGNFMTIKQEILYLRANTDPTDAAFRLSTQQYDRNKIEVYFWIEQQLLRL